MPEREIDPLIVSECPRCGDLYVRDDDTDDLGICRRCTNEGTGRVAGD